MAESGLVIRKLADKTGEQRITMFDSTTGEKKLVNPATPGEDHEPWPFAGIRIENEGGPPKKAMLTTDLVAQAIAEGWIEVTGEKRVIKPAGSKENPWVGTPPHVFLQYKTITIKTIDGDVTYNVKRNPDKYDKNGEPTEEAGDPDTEVVWYYELELTNG
jgi:hypothetical protein